MDEPSGEVTRCPECRAYIGPGAGVDVYKHGLNCLHYPNEGRERVLASVAGKEDEHSKRVRALLTATAGEEA